jgi:adenine-specific DNA-methyltransferase
LARVEDLIESVKDAQLRDALRDEVKELKNGTRFGLVYERHIPETLCLGVNGGLRVGDQVRLRLSPESNGGLRVTSVNASKATIADEAGQATSVPTEDLLVVRRFGEPIYPTLTSLGKVERSEDRPYHAVINSENYHALQLLLHTSKGQVDCIYIDPPYNSGARDWKYNNDFVDDADAWRHSKWLAFMEKRLRLASGLLKPDSVMVVTIDENEVTRLGVLLQQLFPEADVTLVTIVNNPKGVTRTNLSRVEEYAYFCFFGNASVSSIGDDLLTAGAREIGDAPESRPRWKGLLRSGSNAQREQHPTFFYPVLIDAETGAVIGAGDSPPLEVDPDPDERVDGHVAVWPVRKDGSWGRWMLKPQTLRNWAAKGYVSLGQFDPKRNTWGISYLTTEPQEQIASGVLEIRSHDPVKNVVDVVYAAAASPSRRVKTVWHRTSHDAGVGGTAVVSQLVGARAFTFPKSIYAVRDTLAMLTAHIKDALIVDFFAGSGTTLHATAMLNAEDGGRRRTILVTNNELEDSVGKKLHAEGKRPGDPEFERHGIFEAITRPRCEAAITGMRPDGKPVQGEYLDGTPYATGFEENCEFFRLDYLHPDKVELARCFDALHPTFWLKAGAQSKRPETLQAKSGHAVVAPAGYAVLFDEAAMPELIAALNAEPTVTHVFLRTDSEDAYAEMCELLGRGITTERLYGDYLNEFRRGIRLPS